MASTDERKRDDSSVVVLTTAMADSPSRRPAKTRRGNHPSDLERYPAEVIDLVGIDGTEDVSVEEHSGGSARMRSTGNHHEDNEDQDRKLPARPSTHFQSVADIGTNNNNNNNNNDDDEERKPPAREENSSGADETQWSCPRCTLLNHRTSSVCEVCNFHHQEHQLDLNPRNSNETTTRERHLTEDRPNRNQRNSNQSTTPERHHTVQRPNRNQATTQEHQLNTERRNRNPTTAQENRINVEPQNRNETSERRHRHEINGLNISRETTQDSSPATHPLGYISRGALVGAAVGMAGSWIQGRDPLSGAIEGGTTGALSGAVLRSGAALREVFATNGENEEQVAPPEATMTPSARGQETVIDLTSTNRRPREDGERQRLSSASGVIRFRGVRNRTSLLSFDRERPSSVSHAQGNRVENARHTRRNGRRHNRNGNLHSARARTLIHRDDIDSMNYEQLLNMFGVGTENMGAHEDDISHLPTHIVGKDPLPEDARRCHICLEDFQPCEKRTILPCLHGFHQNCARKWLVTKGVCPVCKHRITSASGG